MFSQFKLPGSGGNSNTNSNANANGPGTGNSIFSAIGLTGTSSMLPGSHGGDRSAAQSAESIGSDELPPGWRLVGSRHSGKEYYLHLASGHTQWDRPTEVEPKKMADSAAQKQANAANVFSSGVARMGFGLTSMLNQANSRLQTTLQQRVGIASTHVGTKQRGNAGAEREGQVLVEVFEYERLDGKLQPSDPKRFSDRKASAGAGYDDLPEGDLPDGHEWVSDWEVDVNYTAVDREGWTYATDFSEAVRLLNEDLSHASRHPSDMVRRRRWVRYCQDEGAESAPQSPTFGHEPSKLTSASGGMASGSWGSESTLEKTSSSAPENGLFGDLDDDDDPFHRTAQKAQSGFRVNMKFAHRGGKDNTKDYQSINLSDVVWLVNASDASLAPTDEMMREKTANLEERIKEATQRSVSVEKDLRVEHEKKAREIADQQAKLDALIADYRRIKRENETLQISVASHRSTVEALRKEATEKDIMLNEEQRALNAEMAAANQALEEKAKALATARMRYKRDNKSLAAAVEDAKKRLEQQKAKAESDAQDPLSNELKAEMEKVRQLHAKLEAVRQHRLVIEEESKALFNLVVEKKADLKFKSKKKLETALKDVDEKLQSLKEEQGALTKKLAQKPEGEELRQLNARRNDIRSELGALKERRTMLLAEKRKQDGTD